MMNTDVKWYLSIKWFLLSIAGFWLFFGGMVFCIACNIGGIRDLRGLIVFAPFLFFAIPAVISIVAMIVIYINIFKVTNSKGIKALGFYAFMIISVYMFIFYIPPHYCPAEYCLTRHCQ